MRRRFSVVFVIRPDNEMGDQLVDKPVKFDNLVTVMVDPHYSDVTWELRLDCSVGCPG